MVEVVRVSGQDIAYRGSEGGGVPVVFVHGNSSSSRTWHHLLDGPFGQRHRCLALDLPGHGASPAAEAGSGVYSLPGYAAILAEFVTATDARGAVVVGWSLGGHIALEAAAALTDAAGFVIFGTPPVRTVEDMPAAFLPNPAVQIGFAADMDADAALAYATSFLAPGATLPTGDFYASLATMPLADEVEVVEKLAKPLAILHGAGEQLISLDYLRKLDAPTLWRGEVQVIAGAGHAPQEENPAEFAALLDQFIADLPA
jgi:pimeloyl-ACP methyl ester carboxylesterase